MSERRGLMMMSAVHGWYNHILWQQHHGAGIIAPNYYSHGSIYSTHAVKIISESLPPNSATIPLSQCKKVSNGSPSH
jgi:hypothetical protein